MKEKIVVEGKSGEVVITRLEKGVPRIKAGSIEDVYLGLGYMHGYDRGFQMWFMKILAEGKASKMFGDREDLIEIDKYFRKLNFTKPVGEELDSLTPQSKIYMDSYITGVNLYREKERKPLEFKITGVNMEPWRFNDSLALLRMISYIGLAEAQGAEEKVIMEIILHGKEYFDKLSELFKPYFNGYQYDWFEDVTLINPLEEIVNFNSGAGGSNNWVVSGKLTGSGKPIFCNDPHLEVSRLPSVWYEVVLDAPGMWCVGTTLPGTPGLASGWNGNVSWGMTFSCTDTEDFFIEKCRNGQYLKDNTWYPFRERKETIETKKGRRIEYIIYENEHGVLEGDPYIEGKYLARRWSGFQPVAGESFNGFLEFPLSENVRKSMEIARKIAIPTLNWLFADKEGNIGYQMTGNVPRRSRALSGILPIPGWDSSYDWQGFLPPEKMPSSYNPESGMIVTANDRLDKDFGISVQTITFPPYRAKRIRELLKKNVPLDVAKMKDIQTDVYSLQAERIIAFLAPYLKNDSIGERLLSWNRKFDSEVVEATIFKEFYRELVIDTCTKRLFPEEIMEHIYNESFFIQMNYDLIENQWMKEGGLFADVDWEGVTKSILEKLKGRNFEKWGQRNSITLRHILFGRTFLGNLGFNAGPFPFNGCESTVSQGTKYRTGGQEMTFGPSYRMIVDFNEGKMYSNLPGGASGRPFSRYYKAEIKNWLEGNYKTITRDK